MKALVQEKEQAIALRKGGLSYKDILSKIPVAKSTLSAWLIDLPLTSLEKRVLKHRRNKNITRGRIRAASALRERRLLREQIIFQEAKREFAKFAGDSLFQVGLALYWAEGAKRSRQWYFTNSDDDMIVLMVNWVKRFFHLDPKTLSVRLYTHKPFAHENYEEYWAKKIGLPATAFHRTVYKQTGLLIKKRPEYRGCIRISLGPVAYLKKMLFWQQMLVDYYKKVM